MRKKICLMIMALLLLGTIVGCADNINHFPHEGNIGGGNPSVDVPDLGEDDETFGDSLDEIGAFDGYFEEEVLDVEIKCLSGTTGCYIIDNNTITFTNINEDSVYSISGKLNGNIIIDVGDEYKFDLEMHGFSLVSEATNPILILSGNEVTITAKKNYENYIYDERLTIDENDETLYSGAIHSFVDLEIAGKGKLTLISNNNNGIHSKNDLQVKNLTLLVTCVDNALKGNDSVEILEGNLTLIATKGDGIKTTNSDVSSKGNQRGIVSITGGIHNIYAACDGIDAAYNVVINGDDTILNIYTDKYSNYSEEVTQVSSDEYYISFTSNNYNYSVKYYNSENDYIWVDAVYHSVVSAGPTKYYYYSFPKKTEYSKMQFFMYSTDMEMSQDNEYIVATDYLTPNTGSDTFALTNRGNSLYYSWTNYKTSVQGGGTGGPGGMGGMNEGNADKGDYSTKGIKAANEITINGGYITIKSYDDAIHANMDTTLENGETPKGNVNLNDGVITLYTNDDAVHADGVLNVNDGTITISYAYEGLEGNQVNIIGGNVSIKSSDDGINATATYGTAIKISGGTIYIYCSGDGIDSNSMTSYSGIIFEGGKTVIISNSNGNSAIDSERGYQYDGGYVLAITSYGGMSETTNCSNLSSIGTKSNLSINSSEYLTVSENGDVVVTLKLSNSMSSQIVYLHSNSAKITTTTSNANSLDNNGVYWNID